MRDTIHVTAILVALDDRSVIKCTSFGMTVHRAPQVFLDIARRVEMVRGALREVHQAQSERHGWQARLSRADILAAVLRKFRGPNNVLEKLLDAWEQSIKVRNFCCFLVVWCRTV